MVNESLTREARTSNGKKKVYSASIAGKLDSCMQSNETRTHPHTMHKNQLQMAERLKYTTGHHQTPRRGHRQSILMSTLQMFSQASFPKQQKQKQK